MGNLVVIVAGGCMGGNSSKLLTSRTRAAPPTDSPPANRVFFGDTPGQTFLPLPDSVRPLPLRPSIRLTLSLSSVMTAGRWSVEVALELPALLNESMGVVCSCRSCRRAKASPPSRLCFAASCRICSSTILASRPRGKLV